MKDITFVVPCYNAEAYMKRCLDSLLFAEKREKLLLLTMAPLTIQEKSRKSMPLSIPIL